MKFSRGLRKNIKFSTQVKLEMETPKRSRLLQKRNLIMTVQSKKECVGHVQKRMGTRLHSLKKSSEKKVLSDGKTIGERGRLTGTVIANKNSVEDITKAIWATYYHKASTDANPQHHLCPKGVNSWCQWQKAKALKRKFQHISSLPPAIMKMLKPIYEDLS